MSKKISKSIGYNSNGLYDKNGKNFNGKVIYTGIVTNKGIIIDDGIISPQGELTVWEDTKNGDFEFDLYQHLLNKHENNHESPVYIFSDDNLFYIPTNKIDAWEMVTKHLFIEHTNDYGILSTTYNFKVLGVFHINFGIYFGEQRLLVGEDIIVVNDIEFYTQQKLSWFITDGKRYGLKIQKKMVWF